MLRDEPFLYRTTEFDQRAFLLYVPQNHPLKVALEQIDWESFRPTLETFYSRDLGPPPIDPVRMLKLEFLKYRFNLSDRQVFRRLETDLAFRLFLQVGHQFRLPVSSSLCYFRARLGVAGFAAVFDRLVGLARELGLVKDRLRLKDASHVVAGIAVPTTLALVAQIRDRLLEACEPFDSEWASGQRIEVNALRNRTKDQAPEARLIARVTHLQELVAWAEILPPPSTDEMNPATETAWQHLQKTLALANKILQDRQPNAERKTISLTDAEARRGKHGEYYDGFLVDILMDADSGLLTQINVLPAGGDEPGDAVDMVQAEQNAHGNQIESLSIDGIGFQGPMLRELEGPAIHEADQHNLSGPSIELSNPTAVLDETSIIEQEIISASVVNIADSSEQLPVFNRTDSSEQLPVVNSTDSSEQHKTTAMEANLTDETLSPSEVKREVKTGLGVKVFVPPKPVPNDGRFTNAEFTMHASGESVSCPAGQTSASHYHDSAHHTTLFRFSKATCEACPLKEKCLAPTAKRVIGRTVSKNEYEPEYLRVRQRAKTEEYAAVRREHAAVERKLNELMNHHHGRRAKYWGRDKVRMQELMTGFVVNVKRMFKLLRPACAPMPTNNQK